MPLPLKERVEHTTEASSRIASFTRSRSSARSNFFSDTEANVASSSFSKTSVPGAGPARSRTSVSMETFSTPRCALTPTRTSVGEYAFPSGPRSPLCMIRITISSSAAFEGAHTSTFVRRRALSPTASGGSTFWNEYERLPSFSKRVGGASRGFATPRIQGDTRLWFFTTVPASAFLCRDTYA